MIYKLTKTALSLNNIGANGSCGQSGAAVVAIFIFYWLFLSVDVCTIAVHCIDIYRGREMNVGKNATCLSIQMVNLW